MDRNVADRRGLLLLEHRRPRRAVVLRLEDAADRVADVDDAGIALRHRDVVDASAHAGGADRAEAERREERVGGGVDHPRLGGRLAGRLFNGPWSRGKAERADGEREREAKTVWHLLAAAAVCLHYLIAGGASPPARVGPHPH